MDAIAYIGTEIDAKTRDAAAIVLDRMGMTFSDAIRLMISKTARDNCLPFDAEAALDEEYGNEIPNALTRETMEKVLRGEDLHKAKDFDDLMRQLDS